MAATAAMMADNSRITPTQLENENSPVIWNMTLAGVQSGSMHEFVRRRKNRSQKNTHTHTERERRSAWNNPRKIICYPFSRICIGRTVQWKTGEMAFRHLLLYCWIAWFLCHHYIALCVLVSFRIYGGLCSVCCSRCHLTGAWYVSFSEVLWIESLRFVPVVQTLYTAAR